MRGTRRVDGLCSICGRNFGLYFMRYWLVCSQECAERAMEYLEEDDRRNDVKRASAKDN